MKSYSVIIRTLNGGEKYGRLLDSIRKQSIKPAHVFVIQPFNTPPPEQKLGFEKFIQCKKGMWEQRIYGMEYCYAQSNHSSYLLACDDDICFEEDFAEQLLDIAEEYKVDTLVPIGDCHRPWHKNLIGAILGERTENKSSPFKVTIKSNGRFTVNNNLKADVNPTQSGPFACLLIRTDVVPVLELKEERWLDDTRYAWPDDQVFFYKAYLKGLKTYSCKSPTFIHLDGKAGSSDRQREIDCVYSHTRNIIIFFNRFILPYRKNKLSKFKAQIAFSHYLMMSRILNLVLALKQRDIRLLKTFNKGISDGVKYVKGSKN